jgi:hypothetical protein
MADKPSDLVKRIARQGISNGWTDARIMRELAAAQAVAPQQAFLGDFAQQQTRGGGARAAARQATSLPAGPRALGPGTPGGPLVAQPIQRVLGAGAPGGALVPTAPPPLALGAGAPGGGVMPSFGSVIDTTATERVGPRVAAQQATYARPMPAAPSAAPTAARAAAGMADDVVAGAARQAAGSTMSGAQAMEALGMNATAARGATAAAPAAAQGRVAGMLARPVNVLGRSTTMGRLGIPAIAGMIGGNVVQDLMGNDPRSRSDDAVGSAIRWGGAGAGIGSLFGPAGMAIGGLAGAAAGAGWGWLKGDDMVQEMQQLDTTLDEMAVEMGLSEESMMQLRSQLDVGLEFAGSKEEAQALYQDAMAQLPALAQQDAAIMEQNARSAAIQAAILPLMEQQAKLAQQSSQSSAGWLRSAANSNTNSEVRDLLRAQADQLMASQANFTNAAYGQVAAAPVIQEMLGVQPQFSQTNGVPATDLASVLAQLQLAP